jgi:hypothetical protein
MKRQTVGRMRIGVGAEQGGDEWWRRQPRLHCGARRYRVLGRIKHDPFDRHGASLMPYVTTGVLGFFRERREARGPCHGGRG